jgi:hypothetical protein
MKHLRTTVLKFVSKRKKEFYPEKSLYMGDIVATVLLLDMILGVTLMEW